MRPSIAPDAVLERMADGARRICDSDWSGIGLVDASATPLRIRQWIGSPREIAPALSSASAADLLGPMSPRARGDGDGGAPPRAGEAWLAPGVAASMAMPITVDGRIEAFVCVGRRSPRPFTSREATALRWLAGEAAAGLAEARLLAETVRGRKMAEALALVAGATARSLDVAVLGQHIVDALRLLLGGARTALFARVASSGLRLMAVARDRDGAADVAEPEPGPVEALAVRARALIATPDFLADAELAGGPGVGPDAHHSPVRAIVAIPLVHAGEVIGVLSIGDRAGRVFEAEETEVLRAAADYATVALQNAHLHAQVGEAARVRERVRIASELHDTLGQLAFSVGLKLDWCLHRVAAGSALRPKLEAIRRDTGLMMAKIRQLINHLSLDGPGDGSFAARIRAAVDEFRELTGTSAELVLGGDPVHLGPVVQEALQKTLQEALVNVAKHARATRVAVRLDVGPDAAVLEVTDDGVGLPADLGQRAPGRSGHIGLPQMRERLEAAGGRLDIAGEPGAGVHIRAAVPLRPLPGGPVPRFAG